MVGEDEEVGGEIGERGREEVRRREDIEGPELTEEEMKEGGAVDVSVIPEEAFERMRMRIRMRIWMRIRTRLRIYG